MLDKLFHKIEPKYIFIQFSVFVYGKTIKLKVKGISPNPFTEVRVRLKLLWSIWFDLLDKQHMGEGEHSECV